MGVKKKSVKEINDETAREICMKLDKLIVHFKHEQRKIERSRQWRRAMETLMYVLIVLALGKYVFFG